MAKRVKRHSNKPKRLNSWSVRLGLSVLFLALAYGFASWAIDSGSLWHYAITLTLLYWAVAHGIRGLRFAFAR